MQNPKLLLIRHAESTFNLASRIANESKEEVVVHEQESMKVKMNPSLIDCGITEAGIEQCKRIALELNEMDIERVLVSPLRRAIETAYYLFKDHPKKPKLIVDPIVREMISSSCDIGGDLSNTMKEYPQFDYSRVLVSDQLRKYPNLWSVEFMYNQEQAQIIRNLIKEQLKEEEYDSKGPIVFMNYLATFPMNTLETFKDTMERVQIARQSLKLQTNKTVCVTHSRFLQTISTQQYDDQSKPINGHWWSNCEMLECEM